MCSRINRVFTLGIQTHPTRLMRVHEHVKSPVSHREGKCSLKLPAIFALRFDSAGSLCLSLYVQWANCQYAIPSRHIDGVVRIPDVDAISYAELFHSRGPFSIPSQLLTR